MFRQLLDFLMFKKSFQQESCNSFLNYLKRFFSRLNSWECMLVILTFYTFYHLFRLILKKTIGVWLFKMKKNFNLNKLLTRFFFIRVYSNIFLIKTWAVFELVPHEKRARTLTTWPSPRPDLNNLGRNMLCVYQCH